MVVCFLIRSEELRPEQFRSVTDRDAAVDFGRLWPARSACTGSALPAAAGDVHPGDAAAAAAAEAPPCSRSLS